jgi:hypothetical protein
VRMKGEDMTVGTEMWYCRSTSSTVCGLVSVVYKEVEWRQHTRVCR